MKKGKEMKDKKGLSTIVVTLIIILISLVAVGIVWIVVKNVIQAGTEQVGLGQFTLDAKIMNVHIDNSSNNVTLIVKRNTGQGELVGMKFVFSDGKNSESIIETTSLNPLEEKIFIFHLVQLNTPNLISISMIPVIKQDNKEVLGNVLDKYNINEQHPGSNQTFCTLATCTSLGYQCGSGYANGTCGGSLNCGSCSGGYNCVGGICVSIVNISNPTVNLISPANNANSNNLQQTFNCNIIDSTQVKSLELYVWDSGNSRLNSGNAVNNIWNATITGSNGEARGYDVAVDSSGDIYVTGVIYVGSNPNLYLGKFDSTGKNLWNATINGPLNRTDWGYGVTVDSQGGVYVIGYSYWYSPSYADIYLGKFNSSTGKNLWNATINGPRNRDDVGYGVSVDSQGNVYAVGSSEWSAAYRADIYLGKFNSSTGKNLWNATINGPQNRSDTGQGVAVDSSGNIYVTGYSQWGDYYNFDLYLGKFDSTGKNSWSMATRGLYIVDDYGLAVSDYGQGVAVDSSGNIYVTGQFHWSSSLVLDAFLGKFQEKTFSNDLTGTSNSSSWAYALPSAGTYKWNCLGRNTAGNMSWNSQGNYTLTIY